MKTKTLFLRSLFWLILFAVWTVMVWTVDIQFVETTGSCIGCATLNVWFHNISGVHMSLYHITDWLGLVPVFICILFGLLGLSQLVKRKSLLKADFDIVMLGIYYIIIIRCYLYFEKYPVNYRPVLINGVKEASYPSSTTLLVTGVMPTLVYQAERRLKRKDIKKIITVATNVFSAFVVGARLICGVHWLTDIVGAVILSSGLFCIYKAVVMLYYNEN